MYLLFLFLKCNLSMCVLLFIKYPIWFILTWKSHEHVEESVSSSCQPRNGSSERWRAVLKPYPGICRATPTPWCGDLTLGISGRNFLLHVFRAEHHLWGCVWGGRRRRDREGKEWGECASRAGNSPAWDSPSLLRLVSSGDTGRSFLSALISSRILSWRLRGRGGVGFSFLAEALGKK